MSSSAGAAQQIVQSYAPIESADLFADAFGSQQVAYPPPHAEETQCDAAARKVEVQLVQHARACEIHMGCCREVADNQADVARGLRLKTLRYGFEDGVGVDIEQRGLRTESDRVGQRFILGMTGEIGIAARSGYATQERDVRARRARQ